MQARQTEALPWTRPLRMMTLSLTAASLGALVMALPIRGSCDSQLPRHLSGHMHTDWIEQIVVTARLSSTKDSLEVLTCFDLC